jgi:hypothetical protein
MKNEKDFKKRISEIAAKIAGTVNEEYDSAKINLPDSIKARINSAIANQKDMAQFILDMMGEIISKEPGMADIQNKSGWNSVSAQLKRLAGESSAEKDAETPDVSPEDAEKKGLPSLPMKEAYERIKRK